MATAIAVRCPNCNASLKTSRDDTTATCTYCGTTSIVQKKGAAPPAHGPVIVLPGISPLAVVAAAVAGALVLAGVLVLVLRPSPPPASPPPVPSLPARPSAIVPVPPRPEAPEPAPLTVVRLASGRRPMFTEDGRLVTLADLSEGSRRWRGYVVLDPATGALVTHVEVPDGQLLAALAHGRLLVHTGAGQVAAFDLATGRPQWSTALGDRAMVFCASEAPDAVEVVTADARVLVLDVKTGRQEPARTRDACADLPRDGDERHADPRDRRDRRAPAGVIAWSCGSVRVMGSQSYTVPDACRARARVDSEAHEGIVLHGVWQIPSGWASYGVRNPGTHTPIVAALDRKGRLLWKADVPEGNPLEASTGGPRPFTIAGDRLVAGYTRQAERETFLTAFALEDGRRLWHTPLGDEPVEDAVVDHGRLLVLGGGRVRVIDPETGALVRTIPGP